MANSPAKKADDVPLKEKFAKAFRGFKRGMRGALIGGTRLTHEKNKVLLKGQPADIKRLRGLDLQIGAMIGSYDGSARVPEKVAKEIDRHVKDVADSFTRVAAVRLEESDDLVDVLTGKQPRETPVHDVEFVSHYTSQAGGQIEQRLAKVYLR